MNIKTKALLQTILFIGSSIVSGVVITYILRNFTTEQIGTFLGFSVLAFLTYMVYQLMLSRLEYQATLDKLNKPK
jgi:hypothetical protein